MEGANLVPHLATHMYHAAKDAYAITLTDESTPFRTI